MPIIKILSVLPKVVRSMTTMIRSACFNQHSRDRTVGA